MGCFLTKVIATLRGHTGDVTSIAFHPTLPHLVGTASNDKTAKLWNYETQESIATLIGHTRTVTSIAFHPTLPHLVGTASYDLTAKLWNVSNDLKQLAKHVPEAEQAYSAAHPLTIKTLAGETYTLEGWGSCKDLKAALCKAVGKQLGKPSSFELLASLGARGATGSSSQVQIDGKYGSDDRWKMVAPSIGFNFELTLVYTRA